METGEFYIHKTTGQPVHIPTAEIVFASFMNAFTVGEEGINGIIAVDFALGDGNPAAVVRDLMQKARDAWLASISVGDLVPVVVEAADTIDAAHERIGY